MKHIAFALFVLCSARLFAATSRCAELGQELNSMQKAQTQLLESFVRRDGDFAQTLEQHESKLERTLSKSGHLKRSDILVLRRSAAVFRALEEKEQALVAKFEKASEKLLTEVQTCLEPKTLASVSEQK